MNKYITKTGQNLYDVALSIYGSIEGIFDLLISNQNVSIGTIFNKNTELIYHEDFVLNDDISQWLKDNNVAVKNGNYKIISTNIKEEIKEWLKKTNSQNFSLSDNSYDDLNGATKPDLWKETIEKSSDSKMSGDITKSTYKWENQNLSLNNIKQNLQNTIKESFNLDISQLNDDSKIDIFDKWYSQGMIVLPLKKEDREEYYSSMAIPKIKIIQIGNLSAINMQIPSNRFISIDWGDGSKIVFFHYKKETVRAAHNYNDDGEHTIVIYGHNEFTNLDFSEVNGVYYALTTIYVEKQFITPYDKNNPINKLFTIK